MDLQSLAAYLKAASYKRNITPTHMAMALLALADVMEKNILPSSPNTQLDEAARDVGLNNAKEISTMYRVIAKEIMR